MKTLRDALKVQTSQNPLCQLACKDSSLAVPKFPCQCCVGLASASSVFVLSLSPSQCPAVKQGKERTHSVGLPQHPVCARAPGCYGLNKLSFLCLQEAWLLRLCSQGAPVQRLVWTDLNKCEAPQCISIHLFMPFHVEKPFRKLEFFSQTVSNLRKPQTPLSLPKSTFLPQRFLTPSLSLDSVWQSWVELYTVPGAERDAKDNLPLPLWSLQ